MDKTTRAFFWDYILSTSAYYICTGAVVAKFTEYLALPLGLSNFLTSISSFLLLLQLGGGLCYTHTRHKRRFLLSTGMIWRLSLIAIFLTALLPKSISGISAVSLILIMSIAYQLNTPAQTDWLVGGVKPQNEGQFYTLRDTSFMLVYTITMCAAEALIAFFEARGALQSGFLYTAVLEGALIGASLFCLLRLPAPASNFHQSIRFSEILVPLRDKKYAPVLWTGAFWSFAGIFASGFSSLYAVRILKVDFSQVMIWCAVGNLLRAICTPLAAKLAKKIGWKNCVTVQVVLTMTITAGWSLCTTDNMKWLYPLLVSVTSIPMAGFGLGLFRFQIHASPADSRSVYLAANSTVNGLLAMLGTVLCSWLVSTIDAGLIPHIRLPHIFLAGFLLLLLPIISMRKVKFDIF